MVSFLTAEEVAQQLRIDTTASSGKLILARYRKAGLPYYRFGKGAAGRIVYTQQDVDKWVSEHRIIKVGS